MHLHLDCFAGIAGDMLLGALVDLGASPEAVAAELEKLGIDGWSVAFIRREAGHGMTGLAVDVSSDELSSARRGSAEHDHYVPSDPTERISASDAADAADAIDLLNDTQEHDPVVVEADFDPNTTHEWQDVAVEAHLHEEPGAHGLGGATEQWPAAHTHPHRAYAEIAARIGDAGLSERAERYAQAVFRRIAEAEARVHGTTVEAVHFHEVGAIDSIVDIVGAAVALDLLDVETISATPLPLGRGFTESRHGVIPVPAPATLECLKGVPCFDSGLDVELVTPTGASFVGALASSFSRLPDMTVERLGYGAGNRRHADRPNILRAVLGTREAAAPVDRDEVWAVAANIDDQSAEALTPALEALWEAGAIDVWTVPIVMKKGRLGQQVEALAPPHRRDAVIEALLRHTSTLGVRLTRHERTKLARRVESVETRYGSVRVKVARGTDGTVWNVAPEADDCASVAKRENVPVKVVYQAALAKAIELE